MSDRLKHMEPELEKSRQLQRVAEQERETWRTHSQDVESKLTVSEKHVSGKG